MSETKLSHQVKFTIFAIALLLRVSYVLLQSRFNLLGGSFVSGDASFYIAIAKNVLAGSGLAYRGALTAYVSPGFPLFLAGCLSIFGENTIWISLLQCVLSALVCVFIASLTALMLGKRAGIIAGMIAAIYYELILWTSGQILTEPLYTFLLAAAVYALVSASVSEKSVDFKFALAGFLFGLSALVRPLALAVALGLGILMLLVSLFYKSRRLKQALIFAAVCLLTMQPWGLRNYFALDYYTLTSLEGGHVLWLGNNPEYDLYEHPDFTRFGGYSLMFSAPPELTQQLKGKTEAQSNQIYSQQAFQHIFHHPGAFFTRAIHKTWNMWRPTFSGASFQNKLISYTLYPLLLFFSLIGIFLAWRSELKDFTLKNFLLTCAKPIGLLSAFLLIHLLLHATINAEIRFRVPLWIVLIPFASVTFLQIYDYLVSIKAAKKS